MKIIQQNIQEFMSNAEAIICSKGAFRVRDYQNLNAVLNDTAADFLIFDNGGGRKFDIVFDRVSTDRKGAIEYYPVKDTITNMLKENKSWIYCYQIDKVQTILKRIM